METAGRFTLFSSKIHSNIDSILFVYKTYILYNWSLHLQSVLQCKDRTAISQEAHLYTRIFRGVLRQNVAYNIEYCYCKFSKNCCDALLHEYFIRKLLILFNISKTLKLFLANVLFFNGHLLSFSFSLVKIIEYGISASPYKLYFKWPSMQRWKCPINNGTLKALSDVCNLWITMYCTHSEVKIRWYT